MLKKKTVKKSVEKKVNLKSKSKNVLNDKKGKLSAPAFRRDMPVGEAATVFPEAPNILLSYGLHCVGCGMNAFESIEQGCMGHGMGDHEIDSLVAELNEAYEYFVKNK